MVWGWHWASAKKVMALFFLPFFDKATHMLMASAAAVDSSRSEALHSSKPVRSDTIVWKFISDSSRPCATSGWYGVYCVYL